MSQLERKSILVFAISHDEISLLLLSLIARELGAEPATRDLDVLPIFKLRIDMNLRRRFDREDEIWVQLGCNKTS